MTGRLLVALTSAAAAVTTLIGPASAHAEHDTFPQERLGYWDKYQGPGWYLIRYDLEYDGGQDIWHGPTDQASCETGAAERNRLNQGNGATRRYYCRFLQR